MSSSNIGSRFRKGRDTTEIFNLQAEKHLVSSNIMDFVSRVIYAEKVGIWIEEESGL